MSILGPSKNLKENDANASKATGITSFITNDNSYINQSFGQNKQPISDDYSSNNNAVTKREPRKLG